MTNSSTNPLQHDACLTSGQCLNGGTCAPADDADTASYRHCHCPDGFSGFRCENYCPLQCQNSGVCQQVGSSNHIENYLHNDKKNKYICKCKGYFTDNLCQTRYINCGGHQCLNGATCAPRNADSFGPPWCTCADGYVGDLCQYRVDPTAVQQKSKTAGSVVGVLFIVGLIGAAFLCWRRRRRLQSKRLDLEQMYEERQNLHASPPREERDDWECRNII